MGLTDDDKKCVGEHHAVGWGLPSTFKLKNLINKPEKKKNPKKKTLKKKKSYDHHYEDL